MLYNPKYRNYRAMLANVLDSGEEVVSRVGPMSEYNLGKTREIVDLSYEFTPGDEVYRPGYSRRLAWTEALHLLAGTFDADHFAAVSPKSASMFTAGMAYGPRVAPQMPAVAAELRAHPDSRRAVVYVGDQDTSPPPCTDTIQFLIRRGRLLTRVHMRSWDLWLGLPYDTFMFGTLALALSAYLAVPVGSCVVTASSAHLYERHWDIDPTTADNCIGSYDLNLRDWSRDGSEGWYDRFWPTVRKVAHEALARGFIGDGPPLVGGRAPNNLFHHRVRV